MPLDDILLHPNLAAKVDDVEGVGSKKERNANRRLVGAAVGGTLGFAAAQIAQRFIPATKGRISAEHVGTAMGIGGALGGGIGSLNNFTDKLDRHSQALATLQAETHAPIPFAVAHPYAGNALPVLGGTAIGAMFGQSPKERALGAAAGFLLSGLTVAPLLNNHLQRQRQAYMGAYQAKTATVDPRLLHPGLVERPSNLTESAQRREAMLEGVGAGGSLGALGGAALGYFKGHHVMPGAAAHMRGGVGALAGAVGGAALGITAGSAHRAFDRVVKHDTAAKSYEKETGETIPFMARHPYALQALPTLGAAAYGALRPHQAWQALTGNNVGGRALSAGVNALVVGTTAGALANAASHNARVKYFGGRTPKLDIGRYGTNDDDAMFTPGELAAIRKGEPLEDAT